LLFLIFLHVFPDQFSIFNFQFSIFLSTSRFTALFNQEKEKFKLFFSSNTFGKIQIKGFLYSFANFDIMGQPGKPSHIIFDTLSKASQAESSKVSHINLDLNRLSQRYISLCHQDTVRQIEGNFKLFNFLSKRFAKI